MIKIGIAENHPAMLAGLKTFFALQQEIVIRNQLTDPAHLCKFLQNSSIEILIIDNENMGLSRQIDFKQYIDDFPAIKFLVYSSHSEDTHAISLLKCGAAGFVEKSSNLEILKQAIVKINKNQLGCSEVVLKKLNGEKSLKKDEGQFKKLSPREKEILRHFCDGQKNKHIAQTLCLDEKTISTYKTRLLLKLAVTNLVDLVLIAKKHQIV